MEAIFAIEIQCGGDLQWLRARTTTFRKTGHSRCRMEREEAVEESHHHTELNRVEELEYFDMLTRKM